MGIEKKTIIKNIKKIVGNQKVICALSGGVDSSVTALLIQKAIKNNLKVIIDENDKHNMNVELVKKIYSIAWFNYPNVTAGSPNQVLNLLPRWLQNLGLADGNFSSPELARIKPKIIDVLNRNMRNALEVSDSKISLFEHQNYNTGGIGIPYNYVNDIEGILGNKPRGYHTPEKYAMLDGYQEETNPNRWYNHFFYYRDEFERNSEGLVNEPKAMGSFHPNENGYRNAYLPLYEQAFKNKLDPRKYNGAIFLGLNGPVVKSHGGTDELGFYYSIDLCYKIVKGNLMQQINNNLNHLKNE